MKKIKQIQEFLKDKFFSLEDTRTIRAIIKAKNYNGIDVVNWYIPNSKLIDFLDWFESETKEDNQDTIIFEGKEYQFIECDWLECCSHCDLGKPNKCTFQPLICSRVSREDNKDDDRVKRFVKAFQSDEVAETANREFKGGATKGW